MIRNSSSLILEIIWVFTGISCIAAGIRIALRTGGSRVFIFIIMALICFLFAWFRHRQRKKN